MTEPERLVRILERISDVAVRTRIEHALLAQGAYMHAEVGERSLVYELKRLAILVDEALRIAGQPTAETEKRAIRKDVDLLVRSE